MGVSHLDLEGYGKQRAESSEEVGKKRTLLVCCSAFRGKADAFPNLTLKKIPLAVLHKCEWGKDDYGLNVANLPQAPEPKAGLLREDVPLEAKHQRKRRAVPEAMPTRSLSEPSGTNIAIREFAVPKDSD
jgi:hypothetical protein